MDINHSIRMILPQLVFLSIITTINAIVGRCYLCSSDTLPECLATDPDVYRTVLQYYTEPCNGQCVLFRNEKHSIERGCSWTYGHMTMKSIGWHEISPGVQAYFCDSYLCNNGTYEQREKSSVTTEFRLSPQQLFLLAGNNPSQLQFGGFLTRQLRQCYSCTARFQGCGEFLDPHYASKYIRFCPTSCIIFRNPNDLHLITRDCSIFWPQVHAKSGLHKLFGSDAFFCRESLCNGISFDFIMGIFRNQLPAVIAIPPVRVNESTTPTTVTDVLIESTTSVQIFSSNYTIVDDVSLEPENSTLNSSILQSDEEGWVSPNTTSTELVSTFEYLSADDDDDDDDYILSSSTELSDSLPLIPYYFLDNQPKDQFFDYLKPLAIPPFSWMLHMAAQNQSPSSTPTTTTTSTITSTTEISNTSYEYCKNKPCYHGGRLNSDCFCICLPTFTGDNCETVLCGEEPADICSFILEHECQTNYIRYLCPIFCQLDICLSHPT